jgi:hypothetical protein
MEQNNPILIRATSLETSPNIKDTLNWKLDRIREEDENVSKELADYFGLAFRSVEEDIEKIDRVMAEFKARKEQLKKQHLAMKEDGALWLEEMGIERLDGRYISSVTINKGKPERNKTVFTLLVDKKASEAFLADSGLGVYESVEVPATKDTLKVNKRKLALSEVVETKAIA